MNPKDFDRHDFERLVETYGASETRWPEDYRQAMITWRAENAVEAEAILVSERELDMALNTIRMEPGTDMLKARIMGQLPKEKPVAMPQSGYHAVNNNVRSFGQKAVAAMMLFAFSVGFAGASFLKLPGGDEDVSQTLVAETEWEEIATDYGMDDIYEWVEASPAP